MRFTTGDRTDLHYVRATVCASPVFYSFRLSEIDGRSQTPRQLTSVEHQGKLIDDVEREKSACQFKSAGDNGIFIGELMALTFKKIGRLILAPFKGFFITSLMTSRKRPPPEAYGFWEYTKQLIIENFRDFWAPLRYAMKEFLDELKRP